MALNTLIEWADHTHNQWEGCTPVGPGCDHCYAEARNKRFGAGTATNWGSGATRRRMSQETRDKPKGWNNIRYGECSACQWRGPRSEAHVGAAPGEVCPSCNARDSIVATRARVFCSSLSDVFDNEVPAQWQSDIWTLIDQTQNLEWMLLTKRVGNVRRMVPPQWLAPGGWPKNVRIGATIVNQKEANRDLVKLLALPAPNFVSMEPLLGNVNLLAVTTRCGQTFNALSDEASIGFNGRKIDWVIAGGESGHLARPSHVEWLRSLRDQCLAMDCRFMLKQWGAHAPATNLTHDAKTIAVHTSGLVAHRSMPAIHDANQTDGGWVLMRRVGKGAAGRTLDGVIHDERPAPHAMPLAL